MILALLQGTVISKLSSDTNGIMIKQLAQTSDKLAGISVGVLSGSAEEWRMRARGAKVSIFDSYDQALDSLEVRAVSLPRVLSDVLSL